MHAIVKKATNKLTNQTVAVKIIRSGDPEIIRSVKTYIKPAFFNKNSGYERISECFSIRTPLDNKTI